MFEEVVELVEENASSESCDTFSEYSKESDKGNIHNRIVRQSTNAIIPEEYHHLFDAEEEEKKQ